MAYDNPTITLEEYLALTGQTLKKDEDLSTTRVFQGLNFVDGPSANPEIGDIYCKHCGDDIELWAWCGQDWVKVHVPEDVDTIGAPASDLHLKGLQKSNE